MSSQTPLTRIDDGPCPDCGELFDCPRPLTEPCPFDPPEIGRTVVRDLMRERDQLRTLIREVAQSGVEFEDARIGWLSVQIDRGTWDEINAVTGGDDRG